MIHSADRKNGKLTYGNNSGWGTDNMAWVDREGVARASNPARETTQNALSPVPSRFGLGADYPRRQPRCHDVFIIAAERVTGSYPITATACRLARRSKGKDLP